MTRFASNLLIPLCAFGLAFAAPAQADAEVDARLKETPVSFRGFGTLGVVHNDGDGAAFARDGRQPNGADNRGLAWHIDSRVGVQANVKVNENAEAVFQALSYYRYSNNFDPELTWAFLRYSPSGSFDFRVGRIGFDVYLLSDTRDVGITYPWVRPPMEFYGNSIMPYVDGGDAVFRFPVGDGLGRIKLYSGLARQKKTFLLNQNDWAGNQILNIGTTTDYEGTRIKAALLDYQDDHWNAKFVRAWVRLSGEFPPSPIDPYGYIRSQGRRIAATDAALGNAVVALADDFSNSGKMLNYTSLGVAYENGPIQTQFAVGHLDPATLSYADTRSGYVSAAYRFGAFTPYAVISSVRTRKSDRADALAGRVANDPQAAMGMRIANFLLSTSQQVQHSVALGMRYHLRHNMALKVQVDRLHNKTCSPVSLAWGSAADPCAPSVAWPRVPVEWNGRATLYSASLDIVF